MTWVLGLGLYTCSPPPSHCSQFHVSLTFLACNTKILPHSRWNQVEPIARKAAQTALVLFVHQNIVQSLPCPTALWIFPNFVSWHFDTLIFGTRLHKRQLSNEISEEEVELDGTCGQDAKPTMVACNWRPISPLSAQSRYSNVVTFQFCLQQPFSYVWLHTSSHVSSANFSGYALL